MKVTIKSFDVAMEVKTKGIEFEVDSPDGETHHGDLRAHPKLNAQTTGCKALDRLQYLVGMDSIIFGWPLILTKANLVWCNGKTTPTKGVKIKWDDFIAWADTQPPKKGKSK